MSVIVTFRVKGDPKELERRAAEHSDTLRSLAERAKERGVIAHRFYGSDDGHLMVVDEWPDAESFQRFFSEMESEIGPFMGEAGLVEQSRKVASALRFKGGLAPEKPVEAPAASWWSESATAAPRS